MNQPRMKPLITFFATGGYSGYAPVAPGTAGSLVGVGLYLILKDLAPHLYLGIGAILFAVGIWAAREAERIYDEPDSRAIVIDEVVGMLFTLALLPFGWGLLLVGFLLFRLFDVLKPFPIRLLETRVSGGWGIMLDDLVAALYANLCLRAGWSLLAPMDIGAGGT
jgi:phosphatidylglycerophosphatase A